MLIAGVDDAGRGPVIGPLVIAGVLFKNYEVAKLRELGVKDSKTLTPKRRTILSREVKRLAIQWEALEFSPSEVDKIVIEGRKYHRLNWFEAMGMAEIIRKLHPAVAYVDASDVDEARFARQIKETVPFDLEVVSEHRADRNYTIVGAASIIAKVHRDEAISLLREKYGDFGSGYSSDPKTRRVLLSWIDNGGDLPDCVRKSWKTVKGLIDSRGANLSH